MPDGETGTVAAALERIMVVGVALTTRAIATARPELDLSFPQWRVLVVLDETADGARFSEVSSLIGVTLPATGRQIRRLARRGLVSVVRDEHDRRAYRARLTEGGRDALGAIRELRHAEIVRAAGPFERRATLGRGLVQVAEKLEGAAAGPGRDAP